MTILMTGTAARYILCSSLVSSSCHVTVMPLSTCKGGQAGGFLCRKIVVKPICGWITGEHQHFTLPGIRQPMAAQNDLVPVFADYLDFSALMGHAQSCAAGDS